MIGMILNNYGSESEMPYTPKAELKWCELECHPDYVG